jgi:hypothetical protein
MLTRCAIALASLILMLAIAAWEASITSYPTAFNQLSENIRHIDYPGGIQSTWENIRRIDANTVSAVATVAIAVFSLTLWLVNKRQGSDARVIQRAYVKISHSPPGIEVDKSGNFWLQVSIKNFGQTPARVTDVVMKPLMVAHGELLPTIPDYTCEDPGPSLQGFLVRDDEFFVHRFYSITSHEWNK